MSVDRHVRRIGILGTRGIPAAHGGFETFVEGLATDLASRGHEVRVYCQAQGPPARKVREWRGVELVEFALPLGGAVSTVLFDLVSTLDAALHGGTVLTCGYNTAPFFAILRAAGRRNVVNMDGVEWKRPKWGRFARLWLRACERIAMLLADEIVADHPEIAAHLGRGRLQRRIHVIPYGADARATVDDAILARHGLEPGRYATVVARPEPENSILEIVEAWSRRPRGMPLVVVGDYEGDVHAFRSRVKVAAGPEVRFIGEVRVAGELSDLRRGARLYIHGHTVGGTNPSALEALAAGNAVLAHDNRFNRWVLGDAAAYFRDGDDCARLLDELLDDDHALAAMGRRASAIAAERFTVERCHRAYEALL